MVPNLRITCPNFNTMVEIGSLRKVPDKLPKLYHDNESKESKKSNIIYQKKIVKKKTNCLLYDSVNNHQKCQNKNYMYIKKSP